MEKKVIRQIEGEEVTEEITLATLATKLDELSKKIDERK